ncbi:helix-turn-helix transcriptional regulator [Tateyamaria omphalii]|uniref:helix-turn-helix domain-containing protein n=1 Tax=Tateyamaria omphalii TaxID=299262 RepID=UPI001C9A186E|nr:helix-turn-helix transcriptional regulator [Tateyamaria omphalii]MBY5931631.1 helix-turn-helix transcriptional regulator [Tateyamaria omphalii]
MTDFPGTLRTWRKARRFSQLDLAGEADVSARHISFLESGRAQPSREMIGRLSDALALPLDARNHMLTHAGFAARYPARAWDSADMAPVRAAVGHMLRAHAPYPALALDKVWTVIDLNAPASHLFGMLGVGQGDSLLDLMTSDHLPEVVENWPEVAHHACQRLRTESAAQGGIAVLDKVADHLGRVPGRKTHTTGPVIPTVLLSGDLRLSIFATIAQFGTPEDVALDDLKVELYFPSDDETDKALRALAEHRAP